MSYESALVAAGADVIAIKYFGSYQGDWWAKVKWNDEIQYINGCFGSCSGCDAFECELGWSDRDDPDYEQRLADFGRTYLECSYTFDQAIENAGRYSDWDSDAAEAVAWLKSVEQ